MAKGGRPDKQDQVTGMFSKIAKEADRQKRKEIKEAKRTGKFIYLEHPELLSIQGQIDYFKKKDEHEKGNGQYDIEYDRDDADFPWPYKFASDKDK